MHANHSIHSLKLEAVGLSCPTYLDGERVQVVEGDVDWLRQQSGIFLQTM